MGRTLFVANERERELIAFMAETLRGQIVNPRSRPATDHSWTEAQDFQAPEVYIAAPEDAAGIPALDNAAGTAAGTGTVLDDVPGVGYCQVYNIAPNGNSWKIVPVPGLRLRVFNLSTSIIGAGPSLILIQRTKFGFWVPVIGGGDVCATIQQLAGPTGTWVLGVVNGVCTAIEGLDCTDLNAGTGSA